MKTMTKEVWMDVPARRAIISIHREVERLVAESGAAADACRPARAARAGRWKPVPHPTSTTVSTRRSASTSSKCVYRRSTPKASPIWCSLLSVRWQIASMFALGCFW
mgnify:CR=1 FL=1